MSSAGASAAASAVGIAEGVDPAALMSEREPQMGEAYFGYVLEYDGTINGTGLAAQ
jgi:hypothetical protein